MHTTNFTSTAPLDINDALASLITAESCDPPGSERAIARVVSDLLEGQGIPAVSDEFAPGRVNVVGRLRGSGAKPSLVLSAHMDTVPAGSQPWMYPPFGAQIRGTRMYGRGTSDMKSALVAMIAAAGDLRRHHVPLAGDLVLAFSAGESSNCLGSRRMVASGLMNGVGALLVGEPSSLDVVIAEKGALWLRATATGRIGHVSGDPGIDAIAVMREFLARLDAASWPASDHPLLDGITVSVGRIEGGSAINVTADRCVADIDVRLPPGLPPRMVVELVSDLASERIALDVLDVKPAVESSAHSPFITKCRDAVRRVTGREPALRGVSYFSDAAALADGRSIEFAILGPGELGLSGQPDEYVDLDKVEAAVAIYAAIAAGWLAP